MKELWNDVVKFWQDLKDQERKLFVGGAIGIVVLVGMLGFWVLRTDYQVLFAELDTRDAAAIVEELKRMKVPYKIADGGTKILVESQAVHETRLGLMGRGVPLSGGVGFEIFDNKDVGMTEYTQKINYQRALQGELARTIMAIDQVKQARVHLVVSESGLFKRQKAQPKASVSLTMKPGMPLTSEQIAGIQRLVAAAVPGLDVARVTVSDQRGVTLSAMVESNEELAGADGRLRLKKQAEDYFARKVAAVMDRTFGPGQSIVSVDVTLNFDEIRRTQESLTPYTGSDGSVTGAIVRKRQSVHQSSRGITKAVDGDVSYAGASPATSTTEIEYQIGKTIEQVVSQPGGLRRVSVGVVVPAQLNNDQLARVQEVVGMAVGFNAERGDAVTIQPIDRLMNVSSDVQAAAPTVEEGSFFSWSKVDTSLREYGVWLALALVLVIAAVAALAWQRRRIAPATLSASEREQLLREVRQWLEAEKRTTGNVQGNA
jgi:flagellar M-ring protein FliF